MPRPPRVASPFSVPTPCSVLSLNDVEPTRFTASCRPPLAAARVSLGLARGGLFPVPAALCDWGPGFTSSQALPVEALEARLVGVNFYVALQASCTKKVT